MEEGATEGLKLRNYFSGLCFLLPFSYFYHPTKRPGLGPSIPFCREFRVRGILMEGGRK